MSWLTTLASDMTSKLPPPPFSPSLIFGFDDVCAAITIVEGAIARHQEATAGARRAAVANAASDPNHNWVEAPVFAPMMVAGWDAQMTFPLILRRSLFISICSHVEHVLRQWCAWLHGEWSLKRELGSFKKAKGRESDVHHCARYLLEEAGLALADFETWPEWLTIDACRVARNCLAHNGGIVEDPDDRSTIATLTNVEVDDSGLLMPHPVVHLLPGACEAVAGNANAFFERLTELAEMDPRSKRTPTP